MLLLFCVCFLVFFGGGESGGASRWRVCYKRGLPCLLSQMAGIFFVQKDNWQTVLNFI